MADDALPPRPVFAPDADDGPRSPPMPAPGSRVGPSPSPPSPGAALLADPEAFAEAILKVLGRLHDIAWLASHPLAILAARARQVHARRGGRVGDEADASFTPEYLGESLAERVRAAIDTLEPATSRSRPGQAPHDPDGPASGHGGAASEPATRLRVERSLRRAKVMRLRFIDNRPVPAILHELSIGRSEYFRLQADGTRLVADLLRRSWDASIRPQGDHAPATLPGDGDPRSGADVRVGATTRLVGHDRAIADLAGIVAGARLVTVVGAPGVGKTRLALEVSRRLAPTFAGGSVVVPLADLADAAFVLPAVGRAFEVYDVAAPELERHLAATLRDRHVLLVLDNFEHVLEAGPQVARIVREAPGLSVIATSRAPLGVTSERRYALEPLPVPPADAPDGDLSPLQANPAVELFIDRARAIEPGFPNDQADVDAAAGICRLLDGVPLAIELAAARLATLSAPSILDRLRAVGTLATLASGPRDAPARHRTLHGAIAWSRGLMSDDKARTLAAISVFVSGASLPAILDVTLAHDLSGDGDPDVASPAAAKVIDHLETLVNNHLVRRQALPDGTTRFSLLEAVRAYGLDLLAADGATADARARHAAHFIRMARRFGPNIRGLSDRLIHGIDRDLPNFRAALTTLIETGRPLAALDIIANLDFFWWLQGYRLEGFTWLERAMVAAGPTLTGSLRARVLGIAGHLSALNNEDARAQRFLEEGLAVAREVGEAVAECDSLHNLGVVARARGADQEASRTWQACARRASEIGDHYREGVSLWHLGMLECDRSDLEAAAEWLEAARSTFERHALPIGRSLVQFSEGVLAIAIGDPVDARRLVEGAIRDLDTLGSATGVMYATGVLGELEYLEGNLGVALDTIGRAVNLAHGLGQQRGVARNEITLGHVLVALGDLPRARRFYLDAMRRSIPPGRLPNVAAALVGFAGLAVAEAGDSPSGRSEAARLLAAATVLLASTGREWLPMERRHLDRWLAGVVPATPAPTVAAALGMARALAATAPLGVTPTPVTG